MENKGRNKKGKEEGLIRRDEGRLAKGEEIKEDNKERKREYREEGNGRGEKGGLCKGEE